MTRDSLVNALTEKMNAAPDLKARVKFDLGADGVIFIDTTQTPPVIKDQDEDGEKDEADTTLTCTATTLAQIIAGTQNPNLAYMIGKLKIKGSLKLAMKLSEILEG